MQVQELLFAAAFTYLVHSTLLGGCAWLSSRYLPQGDIGGRRLLWRAALLGGVLTAGLQVGLRIEPLAGAVSLAPVRATAVVARVVMDEPPPAAAHVPPAAAPARTWLPAALSGLWLLGLCILGLRLAYSYARLRPLLDARRDIADGDLARLLARLTAHAGIAFDVRLTCSERLSVPVAFGLRRAEICVPARTLRDLDADQQQALLAHELGHLVHRDPLWRALYTVTSALFFFQPLNWLARRRLHALSELAADGWAVRGAADPVALARCLTTVAGWLRSDPVPLSAHAMAGRGSDLARRIERMLDEAADRPTRRDAWRGAVLATCVLAAVTFVTPAISFADKPAEPAAAATPLPARTPEPAARPQRAARPQPAPMPRPAAEPRPMAEPLPPAEPPSPDALPFAVAPPAPPSDDALPHALAPSAPAAMPRPARPARPPLPPPAVHPPQPTVSDDIVSSNADTIAVQAAAMRMQADKLHMEADVLRKVSADQAAKLAVERAAMDAMALKLKADVDQQRRAAAAAKAGRGDEQAAQAAKAAIEGARREIEEAARQLAEQRKQLEEQRRLLDEDMRKLNEERERLERERQQGEAQP